MPGPQSLPDTVSRAAAASQARDDSAAGAGPSDPRSFLLPSQPDFFSPNPDRHLSNLNSTSLLLPRFAQEYKKDPDRGYGAGVITVFRKLLSPKCRDVYEPAQAQFNGKGSYGNGGAMRVAGISLAYSSVQDVQKVV